MLIVTGLFAQEEPGCGTVTPADYRLAHQVDPVGYDLATREFRQALADVPAWGDPAAACASVKRLPLNAVIVRRSDGTGGLTQAQLDDAILTANQKYADACMEFYVSFVTYVHSSRYYDFVTGDEADLRRDYAIPGALNVYFTNTVGDGSGGNFCGYAYYPTNRAGSRSTVLMANSCTTNGSTFAHELGHAFGLAHTHGSSNVSGSTQELVARTNCTTTGDGFCDTPADPKLTGLVNESCAYTGSAKDANGDAYVPDPTLLMSYSTKACRTRFSPEQLVSVNNVANNFVDRVNLVDPILQADFDATADRGNLVCDGAVKVDVTARLKASSAGATLSWDFDGDGVEDATGLTATNTYTQAGTYDITLTASLNGQTFKTYERAVVTIGAAPLPYGEEFEASTALAITQRYRFTPTANGRNWRLGSGATPSGNTGPTTGHTGGATAGPGYMYFESSGGNAAGQEASFTTDCIQVPPAADGAQTAPTLSFFYHMYGAAMGELHLDVEASTGIVPDVMPAIIGQQQTSSTDPYLERTVDLSAFAGQPIQLRFRTVTGADFRGDVAVDAISVTPAQAPVPVELVSFEAVPEGEEVALTWRTGNERAASHFVVERSGPDGAFAAIGEVPAANDAAGAAYDFRDGQPLGGESYYRLRAVDLDGSAEASPVRSVTRSAALALGAYPNPARGEVYVGGLAQGDRVAFADPMGRRVGVTHVGDGRFDVSPLAGGVYTLTVARADGRRETLRLVVSR